MLIKLHTDGKTRQALTCVLAAQSGAAELAKAPHQPAAHTKHSVSKSLVKLQVMTRISQSLKTVNVTAAADPETRHGHMSGGTFSKRRAHLRHLEVTLQTRSSALSACSASTTRDGKSMERLDQLNRQGGEGDSPIEGWDAMWIILL